MQLKKGWHWQEAMEGWHPALRRLRDLLQSSCSVTCLVSLGKDKFSCWQVKFLSFSRSSLVSKKNFSRCYFRFLCKYVCSRWPAVQEWKKKPNSKLPLHLPSLGELGWSSSHEADCLQRHAVRSKGCCNPAGSLGSWSLAQAPQHLLPAWSVCVGFTCFIYKGSILKGDLGRRMGPQDHWRQHQGKDTSRGRVEGCLGEDDGTCVLTLRRSLTGKIHPLKRVTMRGGYPNLTLFQGWHLMSCFQSLGGGWCTPANWVL